MARYRQVHTKIWKDDWFSELSSIHKLFFIYLFTNELASISGIYTLSKRVMAFESGLSSQQIDESFSVFSESGKAFYADGIVWVPNLRKYHETKSPKVQIAIQKDIESVKDCELKNKYMELYGIDTLSIPENRVSIPRSIYSSSSSSSSNSNGTMKNEYLPPALQELMDALIAITKESYSGNETKFYDSMTQLSGHDATPEQVGGFAAWWIDNGYYRGKPALKSICTEWLNYVSGETVNADNNLIVSEVSNSVRTGKWKGLSQITLKFVNSVGGQSAFQMADEFTIKQLMKKAANYAQ